MRQQVKTYKWVPCLFLTCVHFWRPHSQSGGKLSARSVSHCKRKYKYAQPGGEILGALSFVFQIKDLYLLTQKELQGEKKKSVKKTSL